MNDAKNWTPMTQRVYDPDGTLISEKIKHTPGGEWEDLKNTTLRDGLQTAIWRLEDMLKGDDGQAWKEAEKALPKLKKILEES